MMADTTKLDLFTADPIDKIVYHSSTSIVNDGATGQLPESSKIVTSTVSNPYGKKVFCRFKWSVDGSTYNGPDSRLTYTYTITNPGGSQTFGGLKGAVSVGVSNTSIIFRTANGYHGNVSDNGTTYTYTPVSQTFTIVYALYEVS